MVNPIYNGATIGFVHGTAQNGVREGLKQATIGGASAGLTAGTANTRGIGHSGLSSYLGQMVIHGVIAELRGGKFRHGAVSALASKVSGSVSSRYFSNSDTGQAMVASLFGGLASEASGGSFEDGAMTALMVHLFNDEITDRWKEEIEQEALEIEAMSADELEIWRIAKMEQLGNEAVAMTMLIPVGSVAGGVRASYLLGRGYITGKGLAVIGQKPYYIEAAVKLGAKYHSPGIHYSLSGNFVFLDRIIDRGTAVYVARGIGSAGRPYSYALMEIQYLKMNGFREALFGRMLIK